MATNTAPKEPLSHDWTEAEKIELLEYHAFCLAQYNQCIENVETLYQEQIHVKENAGDRDEGSTGDMEAQYNDLARRACEQVALMAGYLDLLSFIEDEMDGSGLADF